MTAKLPDQNSIKVVPATSEYWRDIQELFAHTPCWCQYWRASSSEYGHSSKTEVEAQFAKRRLALRNQLKQSNPPGVIAYIEDQIVGWCGIGPRHEMQRLVRSRTIPAVDDRPVWSIVCLWSFRDIEDVAWHKLCFRVQSSARVRIRYRHLRHIL